MAMSMGVSFQHPIDMDIGIGIDMIFKNGYECRYSSTHPESVSLTFLITCISNAINNPAEPLHRIMLYHKFSRKDKK